MQQEDDGRVAATMTETDAASRFTAPSSSRHPPVTCLVHDSKYGRRRSGQRSNRRSIRSDKGDSHLNSFFKSLEIQRWDDHRFYHHCRINQSLHFISALCFIAAYGMLFIDPAVAGLLGWGVSMVTRQAGHFFFEPKGYDEANQVTHAYKERVKVGYNLRRKVVLMGAWALSPVLLWASPSLLGLIEPAQGAWGFLHDLGMLWLALGVAGIVIRTAQLMVLRDTETALVWAVKILTDPFHDARLYCKAPLHLLRGERMAPATPRRET